MLSHSEKEAFLDGYRHGLGAAVRAVEKVSDQLPLLHSIPATTHDTLRLVLAGVAGGLRLLSASVVLADDACPNDE